MAKQGNKEKKNIENPYLQFWIIWKQRNNIAFEGKLMNHSPKTI